MCEQTGSSGRFNPDLCPLLDGLSPEAKRKRMQDDPIIRNCVAAIEGAGEVSRETAKLEAAYERRRRRYCGLESIQLAEGVMPAPTREG